MALVLVQLAFLACAAAVNLRASQPAQAPAPAVAVQGPGSPTPLRLKAYYVNSAENAERGSCMERQLTHLKEAGEAEGLKLDFARYPAVMFSTCEDVASCMEEHPYCFAVNSSSYIDVGNTDDDLVANKLRYTFGAACSQLQLIRNMMVERDNYDYFLALQDDAIFKPHFLQSLQSFLRKYPAHWSLVSLDDRAAGQEATPPPEADLFGTVHGGSVYSVSATRDTYDGPFAWLFHSGNLWRVADLYETTPAHPVHWISKVPRKAHIAFWAYYPNAIQTGACPADSGSAPQTFDVDNSATAATNLLGGGVYAEYHHKSGNACSKACEQQLSRCVESELLRTVLSREAAYKQCFAMTEGEEESACVRGCALTPTMSKLAQALGREARPYMLRALVAKEGKTLGHCEGQQCHMTRDECMAFCERTAGCRSISYSSLYQMCYLKDMQVSEKDATALATNLGFVTYYVPPDVQGGGLARKGRYHRRSLVKWEGKDLAGCGSGKCRMSLGRCQQLCDGTPGCLSFTYGDEEGVCIPRSKKAGSKNPRSKGSNAAKHVTYYFEDVVQASKTTMRKWILQGYKRQSLAADQGRSIGGCETPGPSCDMTLQDCASRCTALDDCRSFTYQTVTRNCFLKDREVLANATTASSDVFGSVTFARVKLEKKGNDVRPKRHLAFQQVATVQERREQEDTEGDEEGNAEDSVRQTAPVASPIVVLGLEGSGVDAVTTFVKDVLEPTGLAMLCSYEGELSISCGTNNSDPSGSSNKEWSLTQAVGIAVVRHPFALVRSEGTETGIAQSVVEAWNTQSAGFKNLEQHFGKFITVRYEDLLESAPSVLGHVVRLVGAQVPQEKLQVPSLASAGSESPTDINNLTEADCTALNAVCSDLNLQRLFEFGYQGCQRSWPGYAELIRHGAKYQAMQHPFALLGVLGEEVGCDFGS